ncbi:MAG: triose-phosphate isomerase [Chlorobia bacterium]|nr:triose-phosphate isomerase [Fimbriimonadaceae bacterium]
MRRKLVAGNWKMHMTATEAVATVECFIKEIGSKDSADMVICPTFLSIPKVRELTKSTKIEIGAQDVFWMPKGAFTGQISAGMLRAAGCSYCIVGHSETRGRFGKLEIPAETVCHFGETDHTVNLKIGALLEHGIRPILCVGETQAERDASMTDAIITTQLEKALHSLDPTELDALVIAYEPVWAIGTGKVCDSLEAERVCGLVRSILEDLVGEGLARTCRVLYGGSVKASNAKELFSQPNIDGGLVGGASLDPKEFAAIVSSA